MTPSDKPTEPGGVVERLAAAEVGSRELDYAVKAWLETFDDYWSIRVAADWTTSLDAALALAERTSPGKGWQHLYAGMMDWRALTPSGLQRLPMLVCAAILRAHPSDGESK